MPQPPQLFLSAVVFTHSEPQSVCPPTHTMPDPPEPVVPAVPVMPLGTEPAQLASVRSNATPAPVIGIRAAFIHGRIPDQQEGDLLCDLSLFIAVPDSPKACRRRSRQPPRGMSTVKIDPTSTTLRTEIVPPIASTSWREIQRPSPRPA